MAIYNNRFWQYADVCEKGKRILLTLLNGIEKQEIIIIPQQDGSMLIACNGTKGILCREKENFSVKPIWPKQDITTVMRKDTARIQGYLSGYVPDSVCNTGLIYLDNDITNEDYPAVVTIHPDGRFECKFLLYYPISNSISINNMLIPFYIEPGQTLTIYVDNSGNQHDFSPINAYYMGESAATCRSQYQTNKLFPWDYEMFSKDVKELTPVQYSEKMHPLQEEWKLRVDSIIEAENYSPFLAQLLRNNVALKFATNMLDFDMMRDVYAHRDTANRVMRVKIEDSYFNFLKELPLDDEMLLVTDKFKMFINCYEFCSLFSSARSWRNTEERYNYLLVADSTENNRIKKFLGVDHTPFIQQLAFVRACRYNMNSLNNKEYSARYLQSLDKYLTSPQLRSEAENIHRKLYDDALGSYELPSGKIADIFYNIVDKYKGKYVMVDFWATSCGSCRMGIEHSLELRKKLRDSKDIDFVFITSEEESPEKSYKEYVEKNLEGESCYRIPASDFHYLRELFRFNGIPHYETLDRKGRVLHKSLLYENLEFRLKDLLEAEK